MNPNLYVHVPKTGGTYVKNWLEKECDIVSIFPETSKNKTIKASFGKTGPLCFITHDFHPSNMMPLKNYGFKFTLLRNPFSMFKSFYNYYRSGVFIPHNIEAMGRLTMELDSEYVSSILTKTYEEYIDDQIKRKRIFPNGHFDEGLILSLDFVGISEMMDESLNIVARKLGIAYQSSPKANKTDPMSNFEYRKEEVIGLLSQEFKIYEKCVERMKVLLLMEDLEVH